MQKKRLIDANAFDLELETMNQALMGASQRGKDRATVVQMVRKMLAVAPTIGEEQNLTIWRDTKTNPPTEEDAGPYGKVVVWYKGALEASTAPWDFTAKMPECYPYWMPMPELPKGV